jgi:hypothetical protein
LDIVETETLQISDDHLIPIVSSERAECLGVFPQ